MDGQSQSNMPLQLFQSWGNKNKGVNLFKLPIWQSLLIIYYQTGHQIKALTKFFYPMVWYANYLIWIFMNIYENMRNKRRTVDKLSGGMYNITLRSAAKYSRLPNLLRNKSWDITLNPNVWYTKYQIPDKDRYSFSCWKYPICVFMNMNENIRNKRKW